jgi:tetratricopeptide (TPR) repeat protein
LGDAILDPNSNLHARRSLRRIRSNPILESEIAYRDGLTLRDKEDRQLKILMDLQNEQVPLRNLPQFYKVDASALRRSEQRIGVVGLLVDSNRIGLVTQILATSNSTWNVSSDLPFRPTHIQSLIQRLVLESRLEAGVPELLSFRIEDTLGERCEGDSMDIACLLAIIDCLNDARRVELSAAVAVVSPSEGSTLRPSGSIPEKLEAFCREFGRGSLLVRAVDCDQASRFDDRFDKVWVVNDLAQLAHRLSECDLLNPLLNKVSLTHQHAHSLANYLKALLADEEKYPEAELLLDRLKKRVNEETPPLMRYEIQSAEEDLHRHRGNFEKAIRARDHRKTLEQMPFITSYERMIDSDGQFAAALYDAHRFHEAVEILKGCQQLWESKGELICSADKRSYVLNTLGRCLMVLGDPTWEKCLRDSMEIQEHISPMDVPRTKNYVIHGLLKNGRSSEASAELQKAFEEDNPFRVWLMAEAARQQGITWTEVEDAEIHAISRSYHVYGFAIQAAARQVDRTPAQRIDYLTKASECFGYGVQADLHNVKTLMRLTCDLAVAVIASKQQDIQNRIDEFMAFLAITPECDAFRRWYREPLEAVEATKSWESIDRLFSAIPHF